MTGELLTRSQFLQGASNWTIGWVKLAILKKGAVNDSGGGGEVFWLFKNNGGSKEMALAPLGRPSS